MKQNCKIKDNSLKLEIKTVQLSKVNKIGRTLVNLKQWFKRLANVPDRVRVIKLSNHLGTGGKKDLNSNLITEIRYYKDKQTIRVKANIDNRCLNPLWIMENLHFKFTGHGHYLVTYTTPIRGLKYSKTITDMTLIDATKNSDNPTKQAVKELITAIKR